MLDEIFTVQHALPSEDLLLFKLSLARQFLEVLGARAGVANEYPPSSSASVEGVLSGKRDQLLHDALKLLRSAKGRVAIPVADELPLQIREEGSALVAWKAQFSSIN